MNNEDSILRAQHQLYNMWCNEDESEPRDEDAIAEQFREFYEGR